MAIIQSDEMTTRNRPTVSIKSASLWLFLTLNILSPLQAEEKQPIKFNTPTILLEHSAVNRQDAVEILESAVFNIQLLEIAKQIDVIASVNLSDNEEVALNSILGQHKRNLTTIESKRYPLSFYHFSVYSEAAQLENGLITPSDKVITKLLTHSLTELTDDTLYKVSNTMTWSLPMGQDYMLNLFKHYQKNNQLSLKQAINLVSNYQLYKVYEKILPVATPIIAAEQSKRYIVQSDVQIKTEDGAIISAVIVRKRGDNVKRPTAFQFTIYTDNDSHAKEAMHAVAHGYVGVIANSRGKGNSPDKIVPWEHDGSDATAVIDWISKQAWSDGRVAMSGNSYLGFTQWAAAKYNHPALKTIVPSEAAHPFVGLPVENNIFITPNYQWAFHVTNNKTMDHSVYSDWKHWQNAYDTLFESGRAFSEIDKVEGTPNPWFQKWLSHSSYDAYYQAMLPYQNDYKKINIPVLSITGYFGAAISTEYFFKEHNRYNKNAQHFLLIGPYSHGTAAGIPRSYHSNYKLDDVALEKDTKELTFEWFDHVLFGKPRPSLIKDKVNYQLMGSNSWQHKSGLKMINQQHLTFHLGNQKSEQGYYLLTTQQQNTSDFTQLTVDMSDRKNQHNAHSWQLIQKQLNEPNGLIFMTPPFKKTQQLTGSITGHFNLSVNKRDVDIGFKFMELKPNGETFKLTRYISRASFAKDMNKRQLLTPNKKTSVPIINSTMTAKLIEKGSRLVMVLNVNKNTGAQVNMGTGKDVSNETSADAGEPLTIKWFNDSKINIPLKAWNHKL